MAAYILADVEVLDEDAYREYRQRVDAILARYGGRILVNGGAPQPIEGHWQPARLVVLSFPSLERAKSWYASSEFAEIAPIRQCHARTHFVTLIDGWADKNP